MNACDWWNFYEVELAMLVVAILSAVIGGVGGWAAGSYHEMKKRHDTQ